jgi:hypothetical protein
MDHACNPDGTERHNNAMRLVPPTLSVAHHPNFSSERCLAPSWHILPVTEGEGFSFLLLSENVIIDDDSFTHSLKIITDLGGKGGMTFAPLTLTLTTESIARIS